MTPQNMPPTTDDDEEVIPIQKPIVRLWICLIVGVFFVLFANSLGEFLATDVAGTTSNGTTYTRTDPAQAVNYTFKIYLLGAMSFVWAIVERLSLEITKLKSD